MHSIKTNQFILIIFVLLLSSAVEAEIYPDANQVRPLLPGMQVPSFEVKAVSGERITIDPSTLEKPTVITFFRGGWCPYCNLHLAELRTTEAELKAMGFNVWFMSADRPELLYESLQEKVDYQLYSDGDLNAAQAFGIAFRLSAETLQRYADRGRDFSAITGSDENGLPAPATFIVGTDGRVNFQYTNPDYSVRLAPGILLAAAQAYKNEADKRLWRNR